MNQGYTWGFRILVLLGVINPTFGSTSCTFTISDLNPCAGATIQLEAVAGGTTYGWDVDGDGQADFTGALVDFVVPPGTSEQSYTITLLADGVPCGSETITTQAQPDASLGVVPGTGSLDGNQIAVCSGTSEVTLSVFNASATYADNVSYTIAWGDGAVETFDNTTFSNATIISHPYSGFGYFDLQLIVTAQNGCTDTTDYVFYNGSNPSVGLANPGNTVGLCIPATITFPITNTENNPAGTVYYISISGELVETYTQDNVPPSFTYTFTETSCGMTTSTGNYQNAFDVQIEAINPCASSQATIEPIELSAPPEASFSVSEPFPCVDNTTYFNNTSQTYEVLNGNCSTNLNASWQISPGSSGIDWDIVSGNPFSSSTIGVNFLEAGDYIVTMTIASTACGEATFSDTITVVSEPEADVALDLDVGAAGDDPLCGPVTATFNNQSQGIDLYWYWHISPDNGWEFVDTATAFTENTAIHFTTSGTYEITLFATNDCNTARWDTTLTIAGPPEVWLNPQPDDCETVSLDFTGQVSYAAQGTPITTYAWSFPGGSPASSTEAIPMEIVYDSPGQYGYSLTVANACGMTTVSDTIEVLEPGQLSLSDDTTLCVDAAGFFLTASPDGGVWSGPGVGANGWFQPNLAGVGQHQIAYDYPNAACPVAGTLQITVEPVPQPSAGPNQSVCVNNAPFFLNGAPAGGTWTSNNDGVILNNSIFDPTASGPGIFTLTYQFTSAAGCSASAEKIIIVNALPLVNAGPNQSICDNPTDLQLTASFPPGGIWSGLGVNSEGVFNVSNTPGVGTYTLFYTFQDPTTGCSNTDSMLLTVVENPVANAGADISVCVDAGLIDLNEGSPLGGFWSGLGVNSAAAVFDPTIAGEGLHVLTYTFGSGVCATTDTKVIFVQPLPDIELPPAISICADAADFVLNANPAGGNWQGDGLFGNTFSPASVGAGSYTLTYFYIDPTSGCSSTATRQIEVYPLPELSVGDSTFCATPGLVNLPFAQPSGGNWAGPGVNDDQFDPEAAGGVGNYNLIYSFEDANACFAQATSLIQVIPPPVVQAGPNDTMCIDQGYYFLEASTPPSGGIWSGPGIIDPEAGIFDPELAGGGTHQVTYALGAGNCTTTDSRWLHVIDLTSPLLSDPVDACQSDEPFYLSSNGPAGGQWEGPGILDAQSGLFDPGAVVAGTYEVTYTYVNAAIGCNAFIKKDVTVYSIQSPEIIVPDLGCVNETVQLENTAPEEYSALWNFGDGTTSVDTDPIHIFENTGTYTINLLVENEFGCVDSTSQELLVEEAPTPYFALDNADGCAPLEVNVMNQTTGFDVTFFWYFSNGISSMEVNPGPVLFGSGVNDTTYMITLGVVNQCGASYYQDSVLVRPLPDAEFGISPESNCTPVVTSFANVSTGSATSFFWDFGNGNTSTDSLPQPQTFTTDTTLTVYTVSLTATNACGSDTEYQNVEVEPADVQSFFNVSELEGCQPLTVTFSDYSTPGANIDWEFGDGNSSSLPNPEHTYTDPGIYHAIQYATNLCGLDSTSVWITVNPVPEVSFSHQPEACLGEEVSFTNGSSNTSGHFWDFGDGDTSILNNPTHIFTTPGWHTVTLTSLSAFNQCPNTYQSDIFVLDVPTASFAPSEPAGCVPLSIQLNNNSAGAAFFAWDFGDGNGSVSQSPEHTYYEPGSYPISLVVTDENGCFNDTTVWNIQVHPRPEVEFSFERDSLCGLPAGVHFQNASEGAAGYLWDFGNGLQSLLTAPSHIYYNRGNYPVTLTGVTAFGCVDSTTLNLGIYPQPTAALAIESASGCSPLPVFFNNEALDADTYLWDFGDGQQSTDANPVHEYSEAGDYDVRLIVSSDEVCYDTLLIDQAVEVLQSPEANFEVLENADGSFRFINRSDFGDSYFWDFSDGGNSEAVNPVHRFLTNGIKQVYLEATTDYGCVDDTLLTITPDFMKALYIPNGFSPEQGIGEVRLFKPKGVGLREYHIQVFSAYGELIWESREIQEGQPFEAWDGTYNGQLLPQDVYVWKAYAIFEDGTVWRGMENSAGDFKTMGSVILLR